MARSTRRRLAAILGLLFCAAVLALLFRWNDSRKIPLSSALSPAYWYRHLRGEDRYHADTAYLEHGNPNVREVALTIDDGPDPVIGPQIANYLVQEHVPATFFLVGIRVKQHPEVARLLQRDGFEIGNHTYDHQRLPPLKPHEIANELRLCDRQIYAATGAHTYLMRPPGENDSDKVLLIAKALGYITIGWTVGARDYDNQPPDWIAHRVLQRTESGSIILLHQDNPSTLDALPTIVRGLRADGYRFVTVSEMLRHLGVKLPPAVPAANPPAA